MIRQNKESKFGHIIASRKSLDKANSIRSKIKLSTAGLWVFVFKDSSGKYSVGVQNGWGGALSSQELKELKEVKR